MPSLNARTAFNYFVAKGLEPFQAAGIVGNLEQESGIDPTKVQPNGPGRGIAQWSVGERWKNLLTYAGQVEQDPLSLPLQLDFIWHELTTVPALGLAALKASNDITDATIIFQNKFEICGTCNTPRRVSSANAVLSAYAPNAPTMSTGQMLVGYALGGAFIGTLAVIAYTKLYKQTREKRFARFARQGPIGNPMSKKSTVDITTELKRIGRSDVDPRHVEGWMRALNIDIDKLGSKSFRRKVGLMVALIDKGGARMSEKAARRYGL